MAPPRAVIFYPALLGLVITSAIGCAVPDDPPVPVGCGSGNGAVEVGTGAIGFVPLPAAGGSLDIVRGAQGGIHVLVGFRASGIDLHMTARYSLLDASSDDVVGVAPYEIALGPSAFRIDDDGEGIVRLGDLLVLDWLEARVADFDGRGVRLEVEAFSADGSYACDVRSATLVAVAIE